MIRKSTYTYQMKQTKYTTSKAQTGYKDKPYRRNYQLIKTGKPILYNNIEYNLLV